jgi:hypothetical protein
MCYGKISKTSLETPSSGQPTAKEREKDQRQHGEEQPGVKQIELSWRTVVAKARDTGTGWRDFVTAFCATWHKELPFAPHGTKSYRHKAPILS